MSEIKEKIQREIRDFNEGTAQVAGYAEYNQKDIIERSLHYYLSEYESGEFDEYGFKKYFLNIIRNPTNTTAKALDFDTKDFKFMTASGGSSVQTWYFEKDFKYWFKNKGFAKILNKLFRRLSLYGSAVVKTVEGAPHIVDLRNFVIEQDTETLEDANYIIELHPYSGYRFSKTAKENDWDNREKVLKEFKDTEENQIVVYERYGPIKEKDSNDYTYKRTILADPGEQKNDDDQDVPGKTFILAEDDWSPEELPYDEFHLEKVDGRWLGIGVPEVLYDAQVRLNELMHLQVQASYWASKRIFQSQDEGIASNVLTEVTNGDVLHIESPVEPVATEERNLAAYNHERAVWMKNRQEQTFANTPIKGERMPAGTTLGETQLASRMAQAYFTLIQEVIAEDLKDYLKETVVPYFKDDRDNEHYINLTGEDLTQLRKLTVNRQLNGALLNYVEQNNGKLPTQAERDMMASSEKAELKREGQKLIPAGMYDDVEFDLDILITGEQEDVRAQSANLQMALQLLGQNRSAMKDPVMRRIVTQVLEKGGINIEDIAPESSGQTPTPEEVAQQNAGGGVASPEMPRTPVPGRAAQQR